MLQDGSEKECSRPFSLLEAHECEKSRKPKVDKIMKKKGKREEKMDIDEIDNSMVLTGHTAEVFICQWNPTKNILATGYSLHLFDFLGLTATFS